VVVSSRANGGINEPIVQGDAKTGITLINKGYIFNAGTGNFADGPPYGIVMLTLADAPRARIVNKAGATISADGYAILTNGVVENAGTVIGGFGAIEGGGLVLENTGQMLGRIAVLAHTGANVQNAGLIRGDIRGIIISNEGKNKTTVIENTEEGIIKGGPGTLATPGAAVYSGKNHNAVALTNKGLVGGKVLFTDASASDKVFNKGTITGQTRLGPGNDKFTFAGGKQGAVFGEAGADRFDFKAKLAPQKDAPIISDFAPNRDSIGLSKKLLNGIGPQGPLDAKHFEIGKATHADTRIVYKEASGNLLYDPGGNKGADPVLFAKLPKDLDLSAGDFVVLA